MKNRRKYQRCHHAKTGTEPRNHNLKPKASRNKYVLSFVLKIERETQVRTSSGKLFHSFGAEKINAREPIHDVDFGTSSKILLIDLRSRVVLRYLISSHR